MVGRHRTAVLVSVSPVKVPFKMNKQRYLNLWHFSFGNKLFVLLTYQLLTVGYLPTVASTGNGGLGFDSGEGA